MSANNESSLATRPSLLARLKDWSQQTAWREFDRDYTPLVRNVARKVGLSDAEADEVAQETLIAVARKIGEFEHAGNHGSFRAWLYQQARWRIADQFRARARHRATPNCIKAATESGAADIGDQGDSFAPEPSSGMIFDTDPIFERLWDAEWAEHVTQSAIARVKRRVSTRQFQLFELHVIQGMPVRETARAAGASVAAVYMAKCRVGRLLKREVKSFQDGAKVD